MQYRSSGNGWQKNEKKKQAVAKDYAFHASAKNSKFKENYVYNNTITIYKISIMIFFSKMLLL